MGSAGAKVLHAMDRLIPIVFGSGGRLSLHCLRKLFRVLKNASALDPMPPQQKKREREPILADWSVGEINATFFFNALLLPLPDTIRDRLPLVHRGPRTMLL